MNLDEIKAAIAAGKRVCWSNLGYEVIKDKFDQYLIRFIGNGHCIGLTWQDNVTLNGREDEFFIDNDRPPRFGMN